MLNWKRKSELMQTELESIRIEKEREISSTKDRLQAQILELTSENQRLYAKVEDNRDREIIRDLRREVEEAKRRATDAVSESGDLRRARDDLKSELTDQQVTHTQEIEIERSKRREAEAEIEKHKFKVSCKEEEIQHELKKNDDLVVQIRKAQDEIKANERIMKEREMLTATLQRQIDELKDDNRRMEENYRSQIMRLTQEERDRQALD